MLILARNLGERVIIGNDIVVNVLGIHNGVVNLGFEAPPGIEIYREEIFFKRKERRKQKEQNN